MKFFESCKIENSELFMVSVDDSLAIMVQVIDFGKKNTTQFKANDKLVS